MEKIRVMLVDDDRLAVSYMKEIVDWENLGYEIVAVAYNGKQALNLIDQCSPHLVITDISMPHMGGIELSEKIKKISQNIRVVLLTAYGEFEYARQAVQLGVDYYLIKDEVDTLYMEEKLKALKSLILDQARISQMLFQKAILDYFRMGEQYVRGFYKEKALQDFLDGRQDYLLIEQNLPIVLDEKWEIKGKEQNLPEFLEQCLKIAADCKRKVKLHSILSQNRILLVLEKQGKSQYEEQQKNLNLAESIKRQLNAGGKYRYTIYVSDYPMKFAEIYEEIVREEGILSAKRYLGTGKVYSLGINPWKSESSEEENFTKDIFAAAIEEKTFPDKIKKIYRQYYLKKGTDKIFQQILKQAHQALVLVEKKYLAAFAENASVNKELYDFPEILEWLCQYYQRIEKMAENGTEEKSHRPEVERAIAYIREHYSDSSLKVSDIASYLKISESRISVLFKSETGKTLIQYLTAIRIERAKKLLKTSTYKVYEIAEIVGYNNSQYLSNVFYKEVGCFPLEYKNRNQNE